MADIAHPGGSLAPVRLHSAKPNSSTTLETPEHNGFPAVSGAAFKFPALPASSRADGSSLDGRARSGDASLNQPARPPSSKTGSASVLPAFSFNPSSMGDQQPSQTSPLPSPSSENPPTPTRGGRHRRNGSELIGSRSRGSSIRSISPTKSSVDNVAPEQGFSVEPVSLPRRGHKHRRSGAISSQDLSAITTGPLLPQPLMEPPLTPLQETSPMIGHPQSPPNTLAATPPKASRRREQDTAVEASPSPPRSPTRTRVGFSDALEYIPRPLSMVSTESESSMSTIKEHSMSGSISSVLNSNPSSPPVRMRQSPSTSSTATSPASPRPSSAGFDVASPSSGSIVHSIRRPKSAGASVGDPTSSRSLLPTSSGDSRGGVAVEPRPTKRLAKMGGWASSFLKASKPHDIHHDGASAVRESREDEEATAPAGTMDYADFDDFETNFDGDPSATVIAPATDEREQSFTSSTAVKTTQVFESDTAGAMIDLDAAFGSLDTPKHAANARSARGKPFATARHSMHSSAFMKPPADFGMQYHRRAESAPQLVPMQVDRGTSRGLHSSSASEKRFEMENVFEEEEDERNEVMAQSVATLRPDSSQDGQSAAESGAATKQLLPAFAPQTEDSQTMTFTAFPHRDAAVKVSMTTDSTHLDDFENTSQLTDLPRRFSSLQYDPSQFSDLKLPQAPFILPNTPTGSSASSPRFHYSDGSPITPRLDTSASSFTESFKGQGYTFGEPGPDVRQSVDDVPSLISSRSTMASAGHFLVPSPSSHSLVAATASTASLRSESPAAVVRRKRASIASLSRLMGGSFGEKSKLSHEHSARCQSSDGLKDTGEKRGRRLTKLLKFLKPKASP